MHQMLSAKPRQNSETIGREFYKVRWENKEEGTMGKLIEMRVLMLSQEESNKETKEEVDPVDKSNYRLSMETPKEKVSREQELEEIQRMM
jgi:hypothetical protein